MAGSIVTRRAPDPRSRTPHAAFHPRAEIVSAGGAAPLVARNPLGDSRVYISLHEALSTLFWLVWCSCRIVQSLPHPLDVYIHSPNHAYPFRSQPLHPLPALSLYPDLPTPDRPEAQQRPRAFTSSLGFCRVVLIVNGNSTVPSSSIAGNDGDGGVLLGWVGIDPVAIGQMKWRT